MPKNPAALPTANSKKDPSASGNQSGAISQRIEMMNIPKNAEAMDARIQAAMAATYPPANLI